jgi:hypothetical protein
MAASVVCSRDWAVTSEMASLLGTRSSKPLHETSYGSPALADSRIVIFVQRHSGRAVVSTYLFRAPRSGAGGSLQRARVHRRRAVPVSARTSDCCPDAPGNTHPRIRVANLMRYKRRQLLGVEEIERPFRDQYDRATPTTATADGFRPQSGRRGTSGTVRAMCGRRGIELVRRSRGRLQSRDSARMGAS